VFTARYGLSPYIKQTRLVFKGLISAVVGGRGQPHWPAAIHPGRETRVSIG
jgi:hypothetical protein